ncbi:MAG: thiamine-phosphate kinase [Candidatus Omnitrophica bacterium]|nr:thiamine-phosphate kinase [Candidatus Omnitrophota bacterium]
MKELAWIDYLRQIVPKSREVLIGIGDDCAQVKSRSDKLLLKSDLFIENIHFKLGKTGFKTIGLRAVARVLSDFAACGGVPKFIGISIGIPSYLKISDVKKILGAVLIQAKKYKFSLVGGDTAKSAKLFLDVWGLGVAPKFISRDGAKVGDYIFITGKLGTNRLNEPFEPRLKEAQYLAKNFRLNSMIDISDGFIVDLYRVLTLSKKGACLNKEAIPAVNGKADFYRGEDYELIFTVDKAEKKLKTLEKKFYCVGRVKSKQFGYKIEKNNKLYNLSPNGYLHF